MDATKSKEERYEAGARQADMGLAPVLHHDASYAQGYVDSTWSQISMRHPEEYEAISVVLDITGWGNITDENLGKALGFCKVVKMELRKKEE